MEFRRKLYRRGSSWETTIPMPLIFTLDLKRKHEVVFQYRPEDKGWSIMFTPLEHPVKPVRKSGGRR